MSPGHPTCQGHQQGQSGTPISPSCHWQPWRLERRLKHWYWHSWGLDEHVFEIQCFPIYFSPGCVFLDFPKYGKKVVLHLSRSLSAASARTRKLLSFLAAAEPPELLSPFAHLCNNDEDYLIFAVTCCPPQATRCLWKIISALVDLSLGFWRAVCRGFLWVFPVSSFICILLIHQ